MSVERKKVLVVFYSQTGQLKTIADNFLLSFTDDLAEVEWVEILPRQKFEFPWTGKKFFDAMPESVMETGCEIEKPVFKYKSYDLVIFCYQPWFLSPSIPASAILQDTEFQKILKDTDVVTLIGSRNMWINAQEKIKLRLKFAGARLVGNIVFKDRNPNLISGITIQHWMFSGKKDRLLGIFPKTVQGPTRAQDF